MKNFAVLFILFLGVQGCASLTPINPVYKIIDTPLGVVKQAELGDAIVEKGNVYLWQAVELKNDVKGTALGLAVSLSPQTLIAKMENEKYIYYLTNKMLWEDSLLSPKYAWGGLVIAKNDHTEIKIFGKNTAQWDPKPKPIIEFTEVTATDLPSFKQELIYNGRSGSVVKFLYRELSREKLRSPFTQEIQYDLNEGNTIGFKGVRIEVLDATNMQLKYKIISNFTGI